MKKKMMTVLLAGLLAVSVGACGNGEEEAAESSVQTESQKMETEQEETETDQSAQGSEALDTEIPGSEVEETEMQETESASMQGGSNILVAYFTYAENAQLPEGTDASSSASIQTWNGEMTGNTGAVANMIAEAVGGDLFSIQTVEKYPDSYDATIDQGQEEQSSNARPQLAAHIENLDDYDTIFLGYPNWWSDMPMAVYSFLEEYDLSGKTLIPFVTSGGSGFSGTISAIESAQPNATVQEGISIGAADAMEAQEDVNAWLGELGYIQ